MKQTEIRVSTSPTYSTFLAHADLELKRAERYRIFVSLIVLDLSLVQKHLSAEPSELVREIAALAGGRVRCTDVVSVVDDTRLALLFPETPRQNAMIAGRRIAEMVRRTMSERLGTEVEDLVPMETASYPDAAGAKSVQIFLSELAQKRRN